MRFLLLYFPIVLLFIVSLYFEIKLRSSKVDVRTAISKEDSDKNRDTKAYIYLSAALSYWNVPEIKYFNKHFKVDKYVDTIKLKKKDLTRKINSFDRLQFSPDCDSDYQDALNTINHYLKKAKLPNSYHELLVSISYYRKAVSYKSRDYIINNVYINKLSKYIIHNTDITFDGSYKRMVNAQLFILIFAFVSKILLDVDNMLILKAVLLLYPTLIYNAYINSLPSYFHYQKRKSERYRKFDAETELERDVFSENHLAIFRALFISMFGVLGLIREHISLRREINCHGSSGYMSAKVDNMIHRMNFENKRSQNNFGEIGIIVFFFRLSVNVIRYIMTSFVYYLILIWDNMQKSILLMQNIIKR